MSLAAIKSRQQSLCITATAPLLSSSQLLVGSAEVVNQLFRLFPAIVGFLSPSNCIMQPNAVVPSLGHPTGFILNRSTSTCRRPPSYSGDKFYLLAIDAVAYATFYSLPTGRSSPCFIIVFASSLVSRMQRKPACKFKGVISRFAKNQAMCIEDLYVFMYICCCLVLQLFLLSGHFALFVVTDEETNKKQRERRV